MTLEAPIRIANPDSFEQQESSSSSEDESEQPQAHDKTVEINLPVAVVTPESNEKNEDETQTKNGAESISENTEEQNVLSEKDRTETRSLNSISTDDSLTESRYQLGSSEDLSDHFVRPTSTTKSPTTGIKKFLRRSLPNKLIKTKRQSTLAFQSRTDSLTLLNNLDIKQAPKSSPLDSGNDLTDLMTPMKQFLRKPGLGQVNNFTSVDIPVENQLAEVSR